MLAALPVERATTGASVLVQYLGARLPAEVLTVGRTSAFDPEDSRMKG